MAHPRTDSDPVDWNQVLRDPVLLGTLLQKATNHQSPAISGSQLDEILVSALRDGLNQGKTHLEILNELHGVHISSTCLKLSPSLNDTLYLQAKDHSVLEWKDYYLENMQRIDSLVASKTNHSPSRSRKPNTLHMDVDSSDEENHQRHRRSSFMSQSDMLSVKRSRQS
jgi:hypothetical protein